MNSERIRDGAASWNNGEMEALTLTKYEALGNDFLIFIDLDETIRYDADVARALCDRHRGIGADGLLRISCPRSGGAFFMTLRNGDGSPAETSGNGMRCAVLAAFHQGLIGMDEIDVETVVGLHAAKILSDVPGTSADVRVGLGHATVTRESSFDQLRRRSYSVDVGNPHLVFVGEEADGLDVSVIGPKLEIAVDGGQNVELATTGGDRSSFELATWERGAGYTLACGSGSCAAAAAMRFAGLIDDRVVVHNPGGDVVVELCGAVDAPEVVLSGDARRVATITVGAGDLLAMIDVAGTTA